MKTRIPDIYYLFQSGSCLLSCICRSPSQTTRRLYANSYKPSFGFQKDAFQELRRIGKDLPPEKKYICLLHDEMKTKADHGYNRKIQQVVGYKKPDHSKKMASHVLVFMVIGINSNIKMNIGYFPTRIATAEELYPLLWEAIYNLEIISGLKVISSTSDKASPNQKLYRLHGTGNGEVVYRAHNPYSTENRYVYFFSDVPHLIKTIRNNVYRSRPGGTKYLCNNAPILWPHVERVYIDNMHLSKTNLSYDHVYLTPSSAMDVRLAAQVLSRSVSRVMSAHYGLEMIETSRFFLLVDRFFDCLNGHSLHGEAYRMKPDLAPYTAPNDPRFEFLRDEFLKYLNEWKVAVMTREGISEQDRKKMFLSNQTYEGIVMTVNSFIESTKYLLQQGVPHILSRVFCQDPLEEYFQRLRSL